jgi:hypothetical protein
VRISRIIEDTAVLEARDDLVHSLVRYPAPAQLLAGLRGRYADGLPGTGARLPGPSRAAQQR